MLALIFIHLFRHVYGYSPCGEEQHMQLFTVLYVLKKLGAL